MFSQRIRAIVLGAYLCVALISAVPLLPGVDNPPEPYRILVIQSYHPAFPTHFRQIDGVRSVLDFPEFIVDFEFLDSKRFFDADFSQKMEELLQAKLDRIAYKYDGIIATDDNALRFVVQNRDAMFPETPIAFAGVNDVAFAEEVARSPDITGVVETVSMAETLELIIALFPETTTIYAISDGTPSGNGDLVSFYENRPAIAPVRLRTLSLEDLTMDELAEYLRDLPDSAAVLLLSAYRDKSGATYLFHESLASIVSASRRPVFHLWYHGVGEGILGGKLIDQYEQGRYAAEYIRRMVGSGSSPSDAFDTLTVTSPNRYVFDWRVLHRFGLDENDVPGGSTLLFRPSSLYREYTNQVNMAITILISLAVIIVIQSINLTKRRRTERTLLYTQRRFQTVFDYSPVALWEQDFSAVKERLERIVVQTEQPIHQYLQAHPQIVERCIDDIKIVRQNARARRTFGVAPPDRIVEDSRAAIIDELAALFSNNTTYHAESVHKNIAGETVPTSISVAIAPGAEETWSSVFVSIEDISRLKQTEEELRHSLVQKTALLQEIHHRVKNNLAIVISILNLHKESTSDPATRRILTDSQTRIYAMAAFHDTLYRDTSSSFFDISEYFRSITEYVVQIYADRYPNVEITYDIAPIAFDSSTLIPLGLIATEALTNTFKHAFHEVSTPRITISVSETQTERIVAFSDNGTRYAPIDSGRTIGTGIMEALAEQINGTLTRTFHEGVHVRIRIPRMDA